MQITLNDENVLLEKECKVTDLLEKLSISSKKVALELNLEILPSDKFDTTFVKDGDRIELVEFVGGG